MHMVRTGSHSHYNCARVFSHDPMKAQVLSSTVLQPSSRRTHCQRSPRQSYVSITDSFQSMDPGEYKDCKWSLQVCKATLANPTTEPGQTNTMYSAGSG